MAIRKQSSGGHGVLAQSAANLQHDLLRFDPQVPSGSGLQACGHVYTLIQDRCDLSKSGERRGKDSSSSLSAICQRCMDHLVLSISFSQATSPCPSAGHPIHHFKRVEPLQNDLLFFECTVDSCRAQLHAAVRPPTLNAADFVLLIDRNALRKRFEVAARKYNAGEQAEPMVALRTLRSYITGCFEHSGRSIPTHNKKFSTVLGDDGAKIMEKLGFKLVQNPENKPPHWVPPSVDNVPEIDQLLLDARDELQLVMENRPDADKYISTKQISGQPDCTPEVQRLLGTEDYPRSEGNFRVDPAAYSQLGALDHFSDQLVIYCYQRQCAIGSPSSKRRAFDALRRVAETRQTEEISVYVQTLSSEGAIGQSDVEEACRTLQLDPQHLDIIGDQQILDKFHSRLSDVSALEQSRMKQALAVLAQLRSSSVLANTASNRVETYEDALQALEITNDTDGEMIRSVYTTKVQDQPTSAPELKKAVELIAEHRGKPEIRAFLEFESTNLISFEEACAILEVEDSNNIDEDTLSINYQVRYQEATTEQKENFRKALVSIAAHKKSPGLQRFLQDMTTVHSENQVKSVSEDWPRGLHNIGNTCYLNSLLQYFFSISAVRDVVLNFDDHKDNPDASRSFDKKVVQMHIQPHQIVHGQKFVLALQRLFHQLMTAKDTYTTPETELAILTMENAPANERRRRSTVSGPRLLRPSSHQADTATADAPMSDQSEVAVASPILERSAYSAEPEQVQSDTVMGAAGGENTLSQSKGMTDADISSESIPPESSQEPPPIPPRPQKATDDQEAKLGETIRRIHNEQQDVNEVIDNILQQLRWAIRPHSTGRDGEQIDEIMKLFYGYESATSIVGKEETTQVLPFSHIISHTLHIDGPSANTYQLLDGKFDRSEVEDAKEPTYTYSSLTSPPPLLQLMISHLDNFSNKVSKHIQLNEVVYADRYLDSPEALKKKQEDWDLKDGLSKAKERKKHLQDPGVAANAHMSHVISGSKEYLEKLVEQADELGLDVSDIDAHAFAQLDQLSSQAETELQQAASDVQKSQQQLGGLYEDSGKLKYCLHAVFVHRGSGVSGHWWLYLRDPDRNTWMQFNDEKVEEVQPAQVMEWATDRTESPSLVIYAREDCIDELRPVTFRESQATAEAMEEDGIDPAG